MKPWEMNSKYSSGVESANILAKNDWTGVVKVLRVAELRRLIASHLYPSVGDLTALAMCCKRVAALMRKNNDVWDLWRPISLDLGAPFNAAAETVVPADDAKAKFKSPNLVIASITRPAESECPYYDEFLNVVRLYKSIQDSGSVLESIVIDQIPFFDVGIFEMMLNTMPNLRTISITRCLLLDITKLKPLLQAVHRHPRGIEAKPEASAAPNGESSKDCPAQAPEEEEDKSYIQLDFYPFYFHGPQSSGRLGSFGVTYNEPTFHTPKAVIALIMDCLDLAKQVGMDLLSDSSSFWSFVRRLPGPDDLWALKAREALITREYHLTKTSKPEDKVWNDFADDLTFAVNGDNQDHPTPPSRMAYFMKNEYRVTWGFWRKSLNCAKCHSAYPASLFHLRRDVCWGCKMRKFVDRMEDSHLRLWLESCMQKWLDGVDPSEATLHHLTDFIDPETVEAAIAEVGKTDGVWTYFTKYYLNQNKPTPVDDRWGYVQRTYSPPPPRGIHPKRASLARWRWYHTEAPARFDYREGGPQRSHPCKEPLNLVDPMDLEVGPEENEHFNRSWAWTEDSNEAYYPSWAPQYTERCESLDSPVVPPEPNSEEFKKACERAKHSGRISGLIRGVERRAQHRQDKEVYRWEFPRVEDCLWSMGTVDHKPFNQDKPILDPILDKMELKALKNQLTLVLPTYTFKASNVW
ncbi:uncharacterized protein C8A04DRAFT_11237 [Dichotomopilus funicola]|uniref:Uncharacterized protein n=1 Tax=Dichotomopilus funicola TaxID=1934379 RepID=A0AAN6V4R0_9PEZI|nr:hypothetical protein C8A04DRAFT_11237 [Dichotomopilus funicola]